MKHFWNRSACFSSKEHSWLEIQVDPTMSFLIMSGSSRGNLLYQMNSVFYSLETEQSWLWTLLLFRGFHFTHRLLVITILITSIINVELHQLLYTNSVWEKNTTEYSYPSSWCILYHIPLLVDTHVRNRSEVMNDLSMYQVYFMWLCEKILKLTSAN